MCEDKRIIELNEFINTVKPKAHSDSFLIAVLHKVQELYGYLSKENLEIVSESMNIPTAHIWGVATFYHYFKLVPQGKHSVSICMGTACFVKGAKEVFDSIKRYLNIEIGETTSDNIFTLTETRCLGACGLAPVVMIDDKVYGNMNSKKIVDVLEKIRAEEIS